MGSLSIWHWLIVGAVLLLVFGGRGKISDMMGDVAKGIKAFKKGMSDDEAEATPAKPDGDEDHRPSGRRRPQEIREQGLRFSPGHDLIRKPVPTFRDHALATPALSRRSRPPRGMIGG